MKKIFLLPFLFLLGACAGLAGISRPPEVNLAGLNLIQLGLFEQRFAIKLRVQNPNDVDLPINGMTFEIELNGQTFAKGLSDKAVTVPRFGEAVLDVVATSTLANALKQFRELQDAGRDRLDYRIVGRLHLAGVGSIPFERQGDMPMPNLERSPKKPLPRGQERT